MPVSVCVEEEEKGKDPKGSSVRLWPLSFFYDRLTEAVVCVSENHLFLLILFS